MKRKLIGKWHVAAFLVFCFVFALTASGVFYNQRGKLAGEFGNMVAANLTSYTQAQKRLEYPERDFWSGGTDYPGIYGGFPERISGSA